MRAKVKPRKDVRYKKIEEILPSFNKFKNELNKTIKLTKKFSKISFQNFSSESDYPLPKNVDDAKLNVLYSSPKETKYAWDEMAKKEEEEVVEKNLEEDIKKKEPPICTEMKEGLFELHDLIMDGVESVTNVKHAAIKKELERAEEEKKYREKVDLLYSEANKTAEKEMKSIQAGWAGLRTLQNPLEINRGTEFLKEKCDHLLKCKDDIMTFLKNELKNRDEKFVIELEKQGIEINILIDRIEHQISVLKEAYTKQLEKLEQMIENEKEEIIINNRKIWEALINERNDIDRAAIEKIYELLDEHVIKLDMDTIEQNEKQRKLEIDLNNIISKMTVELDSLRYMCAINVEKISYNYQLLLKRQNENQKIKSQNKRRILKLNTEIESVKKKIQEGTKTLSKEITGHAAAIDTFRKNIKDLEERSSFLATANSKKYFELWEFNQKRAENLLQQIFAGEKVLFEQVLYMPWSAPTDIIFPKESMPSYQKGLSMLAVIKKKKSSKLKLHVYDEKENSETKNLIKIIIENLPKACNHFLDNQIQIHTGKLSNEDRLLVILDEIFSALSIKSERDLGLMVNYLKKCIKCTECEGFSTLQRPKNKAVQTNDRIRTTQNEEDTPKSENKSHVTYARCENDKEGTGEFNMLTEYIRDHLRIITDSVHTEVQETIIGDDEAIYNVEKKSDSEYEKIDRTEIRRDDIAEKHNLFGLKSDEYPVDWFVANLNQTTFNKELEGKKLPGDTDTNDSCKQPIMCNNPEHHPFINPIDLGRAIRDFAVDFFDSSKIKKIKSLEEVTSQMKVSLARFIEEKDVEAYWKSFLAVIPQSKIDLWDTMYMALQEYHKILQKRHDLNTEISKLKKSNYELRRLLQRYIEKGIK